MKTWILQFKKQFGNSPAEIQIEALRDWFAEHEWEPGTANRYKTVLSLIYRLGMEHKKVSSNPARLLKRLKESDGRVRFLNQHVPDEEARLRKVIAAKFPEHLPELDIAVNTGMRRSEQYCRISWACVDLERQDLFVPKSKNGRARHIPLNDAALAAFRKLHGRTRGQGPIFEHLKKGEKGKSLLGPRHWFEDAISEGGIKDFTWHDLRHTFASRLVMQGVPLRAVAELLGHRSIQMTMRYAHLAQDDMRTAVRKLDSFGLKQGPITKETSETRLDSLVAALEGVSGMKLPPPTARKAWLDSVVLALESIFSNTTDTREPTDTKTSTTPECEDDDTELSLVYTIGSGR